MKGVYEDHTKLFEKAPYIAGINCVGCYPHHHENIELIMFKEKSTLYLGSDVYYMKRGELAVISPDVVHAVSIEKNTSYDFIIVSSRYCAENNCDYSELGFASVINDCYVLDMCGRIFREIENKEEYYDSFVSAYLLMIISYLCSNYAIKSGINQVEVVKKSISYMDLHMAEKITVADIAGHVHMSKYHFSREFRKSTGHTVIGYLNFMRCMKAASMIQRDGFSVVRACYECGFDNPSYFSRVFKSIMGYSPNSLKY